MDDNFSSKSIHVVFHAVFEQLNKLDRIEEIAFGDVIGVGSPISVCIVCTAL